MLQTEKSKFIKEIGQNIKAYRTKSNIPLKEIAGKLDLTPQAFGEIENGKIKDIGINRLIEISKLLKIDYTQLLNLEKLNIYNITITNGSGGVNIETSINVNGEPNEELINKILDAIKKK